MDRRAFMKGAGAQAGLAGLTTLAATNAFADGPTVRWRLASSFPKNLDTIYGAAEQVAQRIHAATQGKFQIRPYAAGEIVPGLQVRDAVQKGTVECGHSASYYYIGKNSALAFDCVMPFGLTARQQNAWMYAGGGNQLMADLFKRHHVVSLPCGNTGVQMGGWFRREIHSLADLKGLKMRIPGMGGQIMARLGVIPQTLAGSDVYPSLERGTLDAAWCGASKNKPDCDASHTAAGFKATGEPDALESKVLDGRGGELKVTPAKNGPLLFEGNLEICSGTGKTINRVTKTALCRCGQSSKKPYCDGTHNKIGFTTE